MDRFAQMHNDYLDPDRHNVEPEEPEEENPPRLPRNLRMRMKRLSHALYDLMAKRPKRFQYASLREVFEHAPEGDFKWDSPEAGDSHAWYCDDCDKYHMTAYAENMGRENGKRYFIVRKCDEDGNWDYDGSYDERPVDADGNGDTWRNWPEFARWHVGEVRLWEYFMGWANYWEFSARRGEETLNQFFDTPSDPVEFATKCVDAAWDNVKYLRGMLRRHKRKQKRKRRTS